MLVPKDVEDAIALISQYLAEQDIGQAVITKHGRVAFRMEDIVMQRLRLLDFHSPDSGASKPSSVD